jgi:hypothetical protein
MKEKGRFKCLSTNQLGRGLRVFGHLPFPRRCAPLHQPRSSHAVGGRRWGGRVRRRGDTPSIRLRTHGALDDTIVSPEKSTTSLVVALSPLI